MTRALQVEVLRVDEMDALLIDRWKEIRAANRHLSSPYFDFEFTRCVDEVRDDVQVAVVSLKGNLAGFFPFQKIGKRVAHPVGGLMNDYHGLIAEPGLSRFLPAILHKCHLSSWKFHALVDDARQLGQFEFRQLKCPYVDLSQGFNRYYRWVQRHSTTIRRQKQKTARMVRELGPLHLDFASSDGEALEDLIDWKRKKYQRTKTFDILSVDWTADLLRHVFQRQSNEFQGMLSGLWSGDKLVAAHMGIRANNILHYWFPVFDIAYSKFSPGTQLFLEIARQAPESGVNMIDLGYGDDSFKLKLASRHKTVSYGQLQFGRLRHSLAKSAYSARIALKSMPMKQTAKTVLRKFYPGFGRRAFR